VLVLVEVKVRSAEAFGDSHFSEKMKVIRMGTNYVV